MASISDILAKIPSDSPFIVKEVPGKGLGAFATRNIFKGELILKEKPLLRIERSHYLAEDIEAEYNKLSDDQKKAYMSLASAHGQDPTRYPANVSPHVEKREKRRIREQHVARVAEEKSILSICMTNAMEINDGAGIFEVASRFNHECVPSACFAWNERKGVETIHAVRDIAAGEVIENDLFVLLATNPPQEITLCYCDPFYDVSMRKWELMHYGFECQCRACVDFGTADTFAHDSRERRWKLREWDKELQMTTNDAERLEIRLYMVGTQKEEGLCNPAMASAYLEIARICERGGDVMMAVKAAKKALEIYTLCLGTESENADNAAKSVRAFEKQLPKGGLKK
jgi:hypothetical protein